MKKIIYQVCTKLAACAFLAAVVSAGTASCGGLYQPQIPNFLNSKYFCIPPNNTNKAKK